MNVPRKAITSLLASAFLFGGLATRADDDFKNSTDAAKLRHYCEQATRLADKLQPRQQVLILTGVAAIRGQGGSPAPLLARALAAALQTESLDRILSLRQIARGYVLNGDLESALDVAGQASGQGHSIIQEIIGTQIEKGKVEDALALANRLGDKQSRWNALTAIAREQAQSGKTDAAFRTAEPLKESPLNRAGALQEIAVALGKAGQKDAALEALEEARHLIEQVVAPEGRNTSLASFAISQAAAGDVMGGRRTLDSLNLAADKSFGASWGYVYWKFAFEQTKSGDSEGAIRFAESLPDAYNRVSVLLQIANAQLDLGDRKSASATVALAQRRLSEVQDEGPKQELARSFASRYARLGDAKRAWDNLKTVTDPTRFIWSAREIADLHVSGANPDQAVATLRESLPHARKISPNYIGGSAVAGFCDCLARLRLDEEAVSLINAYDSPELRAYGWFGLALGTEHRLRKLPAADAPKK